MRRTILAATTAFTLTLAVAVAASTAAAQGTWTTGPEMPTPRAEVGAALVGSSIHVIGGGVGPGQRANEILDLSTNQWRTGPLLPRGLNHTATVSMYGWLFAFGGADESGRPTSASLAFDPAAEAWIEYPALPTPRSSPAAAVLPDGIYVVGGIGARNTPVMEILEPVTGAWRSGPSMVVARDHFVLAPVNGKLYAIGGRIGNAARNLDTVEIFDPATQTWSFGAPLPEARSGIAGVVIGNDMYIFGGEDPGQTHGEVFIYDTVADSWSTGTAMPTPRHGLAAIAANGYVHVIGGGLSPGGGSDSAIHEILAP
jgi:N-acetylneuraminic acid mutarotase